MWRLKTRGLSQENSKPGKAKKHCFAPPSDGKTQLHRSRNQLQAAAWRVSGEGVKYENQAPMFLCITTEFVTIPGQLAV